MLVIMYLLEIKENSRVTINAMMYLLEAKGNDISNFPSLKERSDTKIVASWRLGKPTSHNTTL